MPDRLNLPLVAPQTAVRDALLEMQRAGRSAVLLKDRGGAKIIFGGSLAAAEYEGIQRVGEVTQRTGAAVISRALATQHNLDTTMPERFDSGFREFFGNFNLRFATLPDASETLVVTEHEKLRRLLESPGVYKCNGKQGPHFYPEPYKVEGDVCDQCKMNAGPSNGPAMIHLVHF